MVLFHHLDSCMVSNNHRQSSGTEIDCLSCTIPVWTNLITLISLNNLDFPLNSYERYSYFPYWTLVMVCWDSSRPGKRKQNIPLIRLLFTLFSYLTKIEMNRNVLYDLCREWISIYISYISRKLDVMNISIFQYQASPTSYDMFSFSFILYNQVESSEAGDRAWAAKSTENLQKIKQDVTRHRYGDDAHLDTTLDALGENRRR
jgi:Protein of unknown function (DUF2854)